MLYVNQLEHPDMPYQHNMARGGAPDERRNVATSGCGLCCACMIVDGLTDKSLPLEECVRLSEDNAANLCMGTNMTVLGPILSEKFGLEYSTTENLEEAIAHLQCGGQIICLVGHPEGQPGLFTMRSHYITLVSTDGKEFCILDPSYKEGKFDIPERVGKVDCSRYPYLYCDVNTVHGETTEEKYYMFKRER